MSGAHLLAYLPLVQSDEYELWANYSETHQGWIEEANSSTNNNSSTTSSSNSLVQQILPQIWNYPPEDRRRLSSQTCDILPQEGRRLGDDDIVRIPESPSDGPFSPVWTFVPPPPPEDTRIINYNMFDKPVFAKAVEFIQYTRKPTFLDVCDQVKWFKATKPEGYVDPQTVIVFPVFEDFVDEAPIVGHLVAIVPWDVFFQGILAPNTEPVSVVLENTCDEVFTYEVKGTEAKFKAEKDLHATKYDDMSISDAFSPFANPKELLDKGFGEHCVYTITVYPTNAMENSFRTFKPVTYSVVVLGIFMFTSAVFLLFDNFVRMRQNKVMSTAVKQNAIVSSLFPKGVQDRIMAEVNEDACFGRNGRHEKSQLKEFLNMDQPERDDHVSWNSFKSRPIADLFPETTVMFADIAGYVFCVCWLNAMGVVVYIVI